MKLPQTDWQGHAGMAELMQALGAEAGETRYVGGCVRDTLLGLPVSDVDVATRLSPDEVMRRLRAAQIKAVPTGITHGTVTAVLERGPVEVTTLRRDVATDGRRATIAYTDDWREDAARRDFTINALSAEPGTGEICDYFGGLEDLEARKVRFIGDPLTRIAEDHLRILRFFRFYARFGEGAPDQSGLDACAARANDLMALSRERIADELLKLLALDDPRAAMRLMVEHNILRPVLPEIDASGVERLQALIAAERDADIALHPLRRLAALLPADPSVATSVGTRLRLSNKARKRLASAAAIGEETPSDPRALAYQLGAEEAVDRLLLAAAPDQAASLSGWNRPQLLLGGGDLIAMGLTAGPVVAKTLQTVERQWAEAGFPSDSDAQRAIARRAVDQALRDTQ